MTRITGTLHEYHYTVVIISRSVLPRLRNVSDKCCRENQNTDFYSKGVFFFENLAVYEITWKNIVEPQFDNMAQALFGLDT